MQMLFDIVHYCHLRNNSFISSWMFVPDSSGGRVAETKRRRDDGRMLLVASDVDLEMCRTRVDWSSSGKLQLEQYGKLYN